MTDSTGSCAGSRYPRAEHLGTDTSNQREDLDVLAFYVPTADTDAVLSAVFAAGAGAVGDYRDCAFVMPGTGQFRPVAGANPTIGEVGALEHVAEHRVEVVLPRRLRRDVVAALKAAHPYEEPAFHVLETAPLT
ncbi:MAG: hypothetical protein ACTHJJ_08115 [Intrasporangium sp.]|uniref:hypothetical protein n=1 Tax=Intrasporangium sp. TaxID=1925024 RepID=UPI003F7DAFA4